MTNFSKVNSLFSRTAVELAIVLGLPTLMLIACFTPFEEEKEIAVRVLFFIIGVVFTVPSLVATMLTLIVGFISTRLSLVLGYIKEGC